jgi:hypothetical protein
MSKKLKLLGMLCLILLPLTSCAASINVTRHGYCDIYEPVHFSRHDTPETIAAVQRNNAAYGAICAKK